MPNRASREARGRKTAGVPNGGAYRPYRKWHGVNTERCRLYLITPPDLGDLGGFARTLAAALEAGDVAAVQLRLEGAVDEAVRRAAEVLRPIAHDHDVAFLVNDRAEIAAETGCDGVHIGQQDISYERARSIVGANAIVGVSCHDSRDLAVTAAEKGADYVAFGAFYPTATKEAKGRPGPELLSWWSETMVVPCVAIGGITPANCAPLVRAGADFVAAISAVWDSPKGPTAAVTEFNRAIAAAQDS